LVGDGMGGDRECCCGASGEDVAERLAFAQVPGEDAADLPAKKLRCMPVGIPLAGGIASVWYASRRTTNPMTTLLSTTIMVCRPSGERFVLPA
jgi:hypothetical protein